MSKSKRRAPQGGWSTIPGQKLSVDIDPSSQTDINDLSQWTSPHYNLDDNDDDGGSAASKDLYDPDPRGEGNRYNGVEGAGDFGMFYSLEVIPGVFDD